MIIYKRTIKKENIIICNIKNHTKMEKFIELFAEALEREDEIKMTDEFRNYEEWSSIAYLSVIAFMDDEYGIQIEEAEFKKLRTVQDLYDACTNK